MSNSAIQLQAGEQGFPGAAKDRNRIINGQFDIWQRDTSFTGTTGPNGDFTADRWNVGGGDDGGVRTMNVTRASFAGDQQEVPFSPQFYARIQTFSTGGSGIEAGAFVQRIETGPHLFNGQKATASFWARSDTTGPHTIAVALRQLFGQPGGSSTIAFGGQEITLTDIWTFYSLTFDVLSIAGKTVIFGGTQPPSLRLRFITQVGASVLAFNGVPNPLNFQGELWLTNVQFELGDTASDYEDRFVADELALCQRYFAKNQDLAIAPSTAIGPGRIVEQQVINPGNVTVFYPTRMRVNPTLVFFDTGEFGTFVGVLNIGETSAVVTFSNPSGAYTFNYTADAELS